jgi:APA family basic amino acid/polyamine antiporter
MIPISGSAYTYAYATLGELVAWIIGWDLILEYAVGNIAVAIGWAGYFDSLLRGLGVEMPRWLVTDLWTAVHDPALLAAAPHIGRVPVVFNLPALAIVGIITWLLVIGTKESARVNTVMVAIKVGIIGLFLFVGLRYVRPEQWTTPSFAPNGLKGISVGAAIIFFSYIGFDAVSTASEEAKNPQKDIPFGIITSLIVCTILYVAIALVLTGIIPWDKLNVPDPLAVALQYIHADWAAGILALGAVAAMTSVLLVFQLGQARIFMSMARDGLLPPWAAKLHPKYRTPHITTIITGIFVGVFAALAPIGVVLELTNIGTLFAFILVAAGIIVLRRKDPTRPRPFRTPWVPVLPLVSIGFCVYLIVSLPLLTKVRFVAWLVAGAVIYFLYGVRHSRVRRLGLDRG